MEWNAHNHTVTGIHQMLFYDKRIFGGEGEVETEIKFKIILAMTEFHQIKSFVCNQLY